MTQGAIALATAIRNRTQTAQGLVSHTLDRIARENDRFNCFTAVFADAALAAARRVDQDIAAGNAVGPLAGVPFAVKNLFDVEGVTTLAGSIINGDRPPADQDATAIARLKAAGAILVGTLNMDEYAYGFVTVNHHYGTTPNPHDVTCIAGGSSGGSAAAVAANLVPLTLGSDTNGSIRVPAAFCGVYGLKPTYGRLSRAGTFPFVGSLDHIGPLGQTVDDVAIAFNLLQGPDPRDPVCTPRSPDLVELTGTIDGLRIAIAGGHFAQGVSAPVAQAVQRVAEALQTTQTVILPESARARAAAYIITASEGSQLHLERLRHRLSDFDPATRDRLLAGALIPNGWYAHAQRFRRWYQEAVRQAFDAVDVIIAPTVPFPAPPIMQDHIELNGATQPLRPYLGVYTQPLSFIGLPVLSVPVHQPSALPVGVQLIGRSYQERDVLNVGLYLEQRGITSPTIL